MFMSRREMVIAVVAGAIGFPMFASAGERTQVHLTEYNGYFSAKETLGGLKPGEYEFIVTNKAGKTVGFEIRDTGTNERLDMFPLEPGQTKSAVVKVTANGVKYRCPINPTPWYEVNVNP